MIREKSRTVPRDGVEFELTIGPVDPLTMFGSSSRAKFTGRVMTKTATHRFKLLRAGNSPDIYESMKKLRRPGQAPASGLCMRAFMEAFPESDGDVIGFPDPSWELANEGSLFPLLYAVNGGGWLPQLALACLCDPNMRWLVLVK